MFRYHTDMLVGENVQDPEGVMRALSSGTAVLDVFVMCVDPEGGNLAEILHSPQLFKRAQERKRYVIVGLADGWVESRELFVRILEDYLRTGNEIKDFKRYFLKDIL